MKLGLNQNIPYKGEMFHVQTEDGGKNNPFITSHLFIGGAILASRKTSYSDIVKSDKLDVVVKELMTEQQNQLIKELKEGKFDTHPAVVPKIKQAAPKPAAAPASEQAAAPQAAQKPKGSSIDDIILERLSLKGKDSK